jgi:glucosyl-3-phosphoglycerate synthase
MTNDYHYTQFLPLDSLEKLKIIQGIKVSLVIPARNEATTIGKVVATAVQVLMKEHLLLDEIVVIHGQSSDETCLIAAKAGAKVFDITTVRPDIVCVDGKGSAMYKSLFITKGDIIVFCDADIVNFDARFIYGLLGPLLKDPAINCTKAYYARPLVVNEACHNNYGGRVTEIAVRPLLALFYPELAYLHQPLSGEYALRRPLAEALPFSSGYGVEMELLLNIYRRYGLETVAQVNMDRRVHRNRTVAELGKMSFGIMKTILRNCQEDGKISIPCALPHEMVSWDNNEWCTTRVHDDRLPPISLCWR